MERAAKGDPAAFSALAHGASDRLYAVAYRILRDQYLAEDALQRLLANLDVLCQRDDACQMIGELLRRIDVVTKLSAWTEPHQVH